jgi:alkaline phosphatase D
MPLGLLVPDGPDAFEAFANGDGIPLGRELEVASLLRSLRGHGVRNVVWLTADVHYCASHHYDPARAQFTDFDPFWEFVSGPLHAGTFGPGVLDDTFGPEVRFSSRGPGAPPSGPWTKDQFFGVVDIDPATRAATVSHHDREGGKLWSIELPAVGT